VADVNWYVIKPRRLACVTCSQLIGWLADGVYWYAAVAAAAAHKQTGNRVLITRNESARQSGEIVISHPVVFSLFLCGRESNDATFSVSFGTSPPLLVPSAVETKNGGLPAVRITIPRVSAEVVTLGPIMAIEMTNPRRVM